MEDEGRGYGVKIDVATFAYLAYMKLAELHELFGDVRLAADSVKRGEEVAKLIDQFWSEEEGTYADTLREGRKEVKGFWVSFLPLLAGVASEERARRVVQRTLNDWEGGVKVRTDGNVTMQIGNSLFAMACFNYGLGELGWRIVKLNLDSFSSRSPGAFPETLRGDGCFLQLWSAASTLQALMEGLLGMRVDHVERTVRFRPRVRLDEVRITGLRVGEDSLHLTVKGGVVEGKSERGLYKITD